MWELHGWISCCNVGSPHAIHNSDIQNTCSVIAHCQQMSQLPNEPVLQAAVALDLMRVLPQVVPADSAPCAAQCPALVTKCTAARGVAGRPCSLAQLAALNLARWSMCAVGSLRPSGCSRLPQVQGGKAGTALSVPLGHRQNCMLLLESQLRESASLPFSPAARFKTSHCYIMARRHREDSPARGSCQPHLLVQEEDVAVGATRWCGPCIWSDGVALVHITTCMQTGCILVLVLLRRRFVWLPCPAEAEAVACMATCVPGPLTWDVGNYPVKPLRHDRVVRARSIRINHDQRVQVTRLPTEGHFWGVSCLSHETIVFCKNSSVSVVQPRLHQLGPHPPPDL